MAAGRPGDLTRRIEAGLREGRPLEELVQELVDGGLSRAGAERFVDRVQGGLDRSTRERPSGDSGPAASGDGGARWSLALGVFWLSLGSCGATVLLLADATGRGRATGPVTAAIVTGVLLLLRGFAQWRRSSSPFPALAVTGAAVLPIVGSLAIFGFVTLRQGRLRQAEEKIRVEREAAQLQGEQEQQAAERRAARAARIERNNERGRARREQNVQNAVERVRTEAGLKVCGATRAVVRLDAREAIPDLEARLGDPDKAVKVCAAEALVELGAIDAALASYVDWVQGDDRFLRIRALTGFREIGRPAAFASLPHLEEALDSPDTGTRQAAVRALGEMGDVAVPLLQRALGDPASSVSDAAAEALRTRQ